MSLLQGKMYKWLFLSCLILQVARGSTSNCCEPGVKWNTETRNCSDGTEIAIGCDRGSYFKLDPREEEDEYYEIRGQGDESWLVAYSRSGLISYNLSADSYCITEQLNDTLEGKIALVCFEDDFLEEEEETQRNVFFGMCSIVSSFFLALTLIVYLMLPDMRDLQDKAVMCLCASFMVAFFVTGDLKLNPPTAGDDFSCVFMAFLMYYSFLSAFFWLNALSLNIWKSVWFPWIKVRNNLLFAFYCCMGWGLPLCFLSLSLITHHLELHLRPGFGDGACWFKGPKTTWIYFYGPILALVLMNLAYLGMTSWKLWQDYRSLSSCKLKIFRFKCWMYVKLALMMGFTWIFEIISYAFGDRHEIYWTLPDILNVLQGFFIFILFVVSRKKVRKQLAERRPCNIPFPKSWAAYQDEEICVDEELGPDEVELSQASNDNRFCQKEFEARNGSSDKC